MASPWTIVRTTEKPTDTKRFVGASVGWTVIASGPRFNAKITDREAYLNGVTEKLLEHTSGTNDDPQFFRMLDDITEEMIESADDGIEPVEAD